MNIGDWLKKGPVIKEPEIDVVQKSSATIFDFLGFLTHNKKKWELLSDADKKAFSPFMVNRWLSMDPQLTKLVATLSKFTVGTLDKREVYRLYYYSLPKKQFFFKFVKGIKQDKYESELINLVAKYYSCSTDVAIEYLDLFYSNEKLKNQLVQLISKFAYTDKEIKKLMKQK